MHHYKRHRPKKRHAGCLLCKPWKANCFARRTRPDGVRFPIIDGGPPRIGSGVRFSAATPFPDGAVAKARHNRDLQLPRALFLRLRRKRPRS